MEIHSTSMRCIGSAIFNQIRRFKKVCWVCSKPYDRKYFDRHVCVQSRNGRAPPQPRIVQNRHRVIRETPAEIVINTSRNVVIVNGVSAMRPRVIFAALLFNIYMLNDGTTLNKKRLNMLSSIIHKMCPNSEFCRSCELRFLPLILT